MRVCSVCALPKSADMFGITKTIGGRGVPRAQCRECYNVGRRAHYARPEVHAEKLRKRKEYQQRIGLAEERKRRRREDPILRAKEKEALIRYRARPGIRAAILAQGAERRARPNTKADALYSAIKLRAARRGLPFNLTKLWIRERVVAGKCEMTGLPFDYGPAPNGWRYNPMSPSVDQRIAGAGYTFENCRVVLTSVNNALSQYGDDHLTQVAIAYLTQLGYRVTH